MYMSLISLFYRFGLESWLSRADPFVALKELKDPSLLVSMKKWIIWVYSFVDVHT